MWSGLSGCETARIFAQPECTYLPQGPSFSVLALSCNSPSLWKCFFIYEKLKQLQNHFPLTSVVLTQLLYLCIFPRLCVFIVIWSIALRSVIYPRKNIRQSECYQLSGLAHCHCRHSTVKIRSHRMRCVTVPHGALRDTLRHFRGSPNNAIDIQLRDAKQRKATHARAAQNGTATHPMWRNLYPVFYWPWSVREIPVLIVAVLSYRHVRA